MKEAEAQLEAIESTLKGKTTALRNELKEVRTELKPLGKMADTAKGEMEECRSEMELVESRSRGARKKYEQLQRQLSEAQECVEGNGEQVGLLEQQMGIKETRKSACAIELTAVAAQEQAAIAHIDILRNQREVVQSNLLRVQKERGASRATGMLAALQSKEAGVGNDLLGR